jgi:hypothetical protein
MTSMKVVAIIAIFAVLLISIAPDANLSAATLPRARAARHAAKSLAAALPLVSARLRLFPNKWLVLEVRPPTRTVAVCSLFALDCTWLC